MVEQEQDGWLFEISHIVPDVEWNQYKSLKSAENILRAGKVRKWLTEELATSEGDDTWLVHFEWSHLSRVCAYLLIKDDKLATYFKLKWML
jgi:hypothetical protein